MTIEEFARLVAALKHFGPEHRDEVLSRKGVRDGEHAEAERRWTQAIVDTTSQEDNSVIEAFGLAFAAEQRRLREERPPLSSLGALAASPTSVAASGVSPVIEQAAAGSATSPPVDPAPEAMTPSFLQQDSSAGPGRLVAPPAPPPSAQGDETVIGGVPSPMPLPFAGRLGGPPPASPVTRSPDAGGTVMAPLPEEVRAALVRLIEPDPDTTQLPVPNSRPVVPFSGTSTPGQMREIAGPPVVTPSDEAGATVMMPVPREANKAVELAQSDLTLQEYAALRAALSVYGEESAEVLSRFGLTPARKQLVQEGYFELFRTDPALREQFASLLREEMRRLNQGTGGGR